MPEGRLLDDDSPFSSLNDDDAWVDLVRVSREKPPLGSIGPFELLGEAQRGGQGVVFRVRQPSTNRTIAIKRFHSGVLERPSTLRRFEREVEAVAALNHPGIVTLFGVEFVEGAPLLTMEWVEGEPVAAWAARQGNERDAVERKLRCFLEICNAVAYAHRRGILHRDLKSSNVLMDETGRTRVLDFGLAQRLGPEGETGQLGTEGILGTPGYAAPEQLRDGENGLDVRSDVYSLAVMLHEMLTGSLPFAHGAERGGANGPGPAAGIAMGGAADLDAVVSKGLAADPDQRYQTVAALAEDIERYLDDRPLLGVPASRATLAWKWIRRNRVLAAASAVLLVGALAFVAQALRHSVAVGRERDLARVAQERAERARNEAESILDFFLYTLVDPVASGGPGEGETVASALQRVMTTVEDRFGDKPAIEAEIRAVGAQALKMAGHFEEAREILVDTLAELDRTGLAVPRARVSAERTLAMLDAESDRLGPALEHAEAALRALDDDATPSSRARTLLTQVEVLTRMRRFEEAEGSCRAALEYLREAGLSDVDSTTVDARMLLGFVVRHQGRAAEGVAITKALLHDMEQHHGVASPETVPVRLNVALGQRGTGDFEGAFETFTRAVEVVEQLYRPDDPARITHALGMGLLLRDLERHAEATAWLERIIGAPQPSVRVQALEALVASLFTLERGDDAVQILRTALEQELERTGSISRSSMFTELELLISLLRTGHGDEVRERLGPYLERLSQAAENGDLPVEAALREFRERAESEGIDTAGLPEF